MPEPSQLTILCLASDVKGQALIRECHRQGCRVLLITRPHLAQADWPRECIEEMFYLPSLLHRDDLVKSISHLARTRVIDRIIALDDFDVEQASLLREHLRIPGLGETTARYFRDKLAMRVRAKEAGVLVPEFVHALNYDAVRSFMARVPPPWILKPRSEAAAAGIKKVPTADELWRHLEALGDRQAFFLLEQFVPGDIYHVDAVISERRVAFAAYHRYGSPPLDVAQGGGLFITRTLPHRSDEVKELSLVNRQILGCLGLVRGVTHTELIRGREDGKLYFLETAARVGGAYIAEVIEAATGVNLWAEWAKIEIGSGKIPYPAPKARKHYAGVILSLAREEWPDMSAYDDPEIVARVKKPHHAGLIVSSKDSARVEALLADYGPRFYRDFFATGPAPERVER